jgi:hypothetical protein
VQWAKALSAGPAVATRSVDQRRAAPLRWGPEHQARIGRRDKSAVIAARGNTTLGHSRRTGEISPEAGNAELAPLGHLAPIAMGTRSQSSCRPASVRGRSIALWDGQGRAYPRLRLAIQAKHQNRAVPFDNGRSVRSCDIEYGLQPPKNDPSQTMGWHPHLRSAGRRRPRKPLSGRATDRIKGDCA